MINKPLSQRAPTLPGSSDAEVKLCDGTSVPGFALGGAAPPAIPVSGLTQSTSSRRRSPPFAPLVLLHSPRIRSEFGGSAKLIHERTQPVWSGELQAGKPSAERSAAVLIGQPIT